MKIFADAVIIKSYEKDQQINIKSYILALQDFPGQDQINCECEVS